VIYFVPKHFKPREGSHIPVLIKILSIADGPVLELGTGFNSTPVLHWLCNENKRELVSYESSPEYFEVAKRYISDFHQVNLVEDENWDTIDIESRHWSVVFIDHAPGPRRVVELERVAQHADYVIVHDTERRSSWHRRYRKGFPKYKERWDYTTAYPYTSVLSNFKDLSNL